MSSKKKYTLEEKMKYYEKKNNAQAEKNDSMYDNHFKNNYVYSHEYGVANDVGGIVIAYTKKAFNMFTKLFYKPEFKKGVYKELYYMARSVGDSHQEAVKYAQKQSKNRLTVIRKNKKKINPKSFK